MKFLAFRPLVLEPDFDLRFVQFEFTAQLEALFVVQVSVWRRRGRRLADAIGLCGPENAFRDALCSALLHNAAVQPLRWRMFTGASEQFKWPH